MHVNTCTKYIFSCILLVVDCRLTIVDLDPSAMLRAGSLDRLRAGSFDRLRAGYFVQDRVLSWVEFEPNQQGNWLIGGMVN